jgi:hypothetical protein
MRLEASQIYCFFLERLNKMLSQFLACTWNPASDATLVMLKPWLRCIVRMLRQQLLHAEAASKIMISDPNKCSV